MNNLTLSLISAILIGLGATLTTDLWALFLKHAFKITSPNYCLVGRCNLKSTLEKQRP